MDEASKRSEARRRPKDPEGNRAAILAAAVAEFAAKGFQGARMNSIAEAGGCDKQLLYYYYSSKERLYIASLEHAYTQVRVSQADRPVDREDPLKSLCEIVLVSYDFVIEHPDIIRLIANENIEKARYLRQSSVVQSINLPIIEKMREILDIGVAKGLFRSDIDPIELHHVTSALTNHYFNNAYTFGYIFSVDLFSPESIEAYRKTIEKVVSGFVLRPRSVAESLQQGHAPVTPEQHEWAASST